MHGICSWTRSLFLVQQTCAALECCLVFLLQTIWVRIVDALYRCLHWTRETFRSLHTVIMSMFVCLRVRVKGSTWTKTGSNHLRSYWEASPNAPSGIFDWIFFSPLFFRGRDPMVKVGSLASVSSRMRHRGDHMITCDRSHRESSGVSRSILAFCSFNHPFICLTDQTLSWRDAREAGSES